MASAVLSFLLALAISGVRGGTLEGERTAIEGRVVDARGAPAGGVRVILGEFGHATLFYNSPKQTFVATPGVPDSDRDRFGRETATDSQGRFVVEGLAAGEYSLVASDESRGIGIGTARVPEKGKVAATLVLSSPAFVELEVAGLPFDPRRNLVELTPSTNGTNIQFNPWLQPVPGSWNVLSTALPALSTWRAVGTEIVFGQAYRATVFALPIRVTTGESRRVVVDTAKGSELSGSVADAEGKPLEGVSVVARSLGADALELGAVTDAAGRYKIRGLGNGKHVLEVQRWKVRELAGCGNGAQDVALSREIVLPLPDGERADFRVDELLPAPKVGDPAPPFEAPTLDGKTLASRDLRGKVVLLDFWATWCGSCRLEMPGLIESYEKFARDGRFEIVGVSVDSDVALVPRFVSSRGLRWPQTAAGPAAGNPIARLFNVNSTPSTVLIDASGRIAALNAVGEPLRRKIEELLAAK